MADSDFSAIAEIVPQASYELVGRIVPGIVVMATLAVAAMGPARALVFLDQTIIHPDPALSGWAIVLALMTAYVLAFVLDGVWQIPACVRRRGVKPAPPDLRAPSTSLKFDIVNQELPKAGAWLTKLYAETNTTQVLIIGWLFGAAMNAYFLAAAFSADRLWLEVVLVVGIVGALAVRNSIAMTRETSLENLWVLLKESDR